MVIFHSCYNSIWFFRCYFCIENFQIEIMSELSKFNTFPPDLKQTGYLMPVLLIGHGSPMNRIENNEFFRRWKEPVLEIPQPDAVLAMKILHSPLKTTAIARRYDEAILWVWQEKTNATANTTPFAHAAFLDLIILMTCNKEKMS